MVARYYDPATGTFLTRDPLDALTGKAYQYADGDPVDLADPTGMGVLSDIGSALKAGAEGAVNGAAGVANVVTSTITLGHVHVGPVFCGPGLLLSYDFGNAAGILDEVVAGGAAVYYGGAAVVASDAEAAAALALRSALLGSPVALYDLGKCLGGDQASCIGAAVAIAGVFGAGLSTVQAIGEELAGALGSLGGAAGAASTVYDSVLNFFGLNDQSDDSS